MIYRNINRELEFSVNGMYILQVKRNDHWNDLLNFPVLKNDSDKIILYSNFESVLSFSFESVEDSMNYGLGSESGDLEAPGGSFGLFVLKIWLLTRLISVNLDILGTLYEISSNNWV